MSKDFAEDMVVFSAYQPSLPIHVLLREGTSAGAFLREFWKPSKDGAGVPIPGLKSAAGKDGKKIALSIADEIDAIVKLGQAADAEYLAAARMNFAPDKYKRADFLESEIEAVLIWYFDDDVEDDKDAQLAAVQKSPAMLSESIAAKAQSLIQLATLARPYAAELDGLGDFDIKYLDEAEALAKELNELKAPTGPQTTATKAALEKRNATLGVLANRVGKVRKAAQYVFRAHPAIAQRATSSYERNRRAALRRAKAAATAAAAALAAQGEVSVG